MPRDFSAVGISADLRARDPGESCKSGLSTLAEPECSRERKSSADMEEVQLVEFRPKLAHLHSGGRSPDTRTKSHIIVRHYRLRSFRRSSMRASALPAIRDCAAM